MSQKFKQRYSEYKEIMQKAADLNYASAVLGWDQEVYMPPKGVSARSRQLATLAAEAHRILTSDQLGNLLEELMAIPHTPEFDTEITNVLLTRYDFERNKKLPGSFVEELSVLTSTGFNSWLDARNKNDYKIFAPILEKLINLKRRQADLLGYSEHPYNALLNEYERGATVSMLDPIFNEIKIQFPILLNSILNGRMVSNDCFHQHLDKQQQFDFSIDVLKGMGYDFEAGRLDYSEHPFTTSFSSSDVRITSRVDEHNFASMLWSCIHEGGHGLYEQGLPESQYGLPLGEAASLGIHESQSRLWENCIGRGKEFWDYYFPLLQQKFPAQFKNVSHSEFLNACNLVSPSLIRTEADEATYHFHVMIRYELEKALLDRSLKPADLPCAWNDLYRKYLGIMPTDDKTGVLQDVHWSHGMFGYFPTYTLGSFYAVQFFEQAEKEIANLNAKIAAGNFTELLQWLRAKIHIHGRRFTSEELCQKITGKKLDPSVFLSYASKKYNGIYGRN